MDNALRLHALVGWTVGNRPATPPERAAWDDALMAALIAG
jgi:hypothetical protein